MSEITSSIVKFDIGISFSDNDVSNCNLESPDTCAAFPIYKAEWPMMS